MYRDRVLELAALAVMAVAIAIIAHAKLLLVARPIGRIGMDTTYFRENAVRCLRLADGLSLNNPARVQLLELAHDFNRRAQELEAANTRRDETAGRNDRA